MGSAGVACPGGGSWVLGGHRAAKEMGLEARGLQAAGAAGLSPGGCLVTWEPHCRSCKGLLLRSCKVCSKEAQHLQHAAFCTEACRCAATSRHRGPGPHKGAQDVAQGGAR